MKLFNIIVFVIGIFITSCQNTDREFKLILHSGNGVALIETWIYCDSLQMISTTEADVWIDGKKTKIWADRGIKVCNSHSR